MSLEILMIAILFFIVGGGIGFYVRHLGVVKEKKNSERKKHDIISKAKKDAQEIKRIARSDAKQVIRDEREQLEKDLGKKQKSIGDQERALTKKELALEQKIEERDRELLKLEQKEKELEDKKERADREVERQKEIQREYSEKLSVVAGMTKDQAKSELVAAMEEEAKVDAAQKIRRVEEETQEKSEQLSKRIMAIAMQRFAGDFVAEHTISSVELPGDEIKGRLIGREGRNIRAFEQICGVDLIIDDTPGVVVIASFNVVRKEIAKSTIERLIADGRIHPAKIEEFYEKAKVEMDARVRDLGEKAQMEIGVHGIHPEILKMLGALNWRTSYTQNQYQHSLEVAFFCGAMAAELGLNVKQARRAGLLHDIGKAMDASFEGSHAMIGADFLKKFGEAPDVVHAIRAHHEDEKPESVLAYLVIAADAMSGARPGARKALMESYVSRLTDIENIVNGFDGVARSFAISAGREIRVIVENEKVSDEQTVMLSRDIAKKIEEEMSYPGTIKVNVIRETRAVGIAK